MASDWTATKLEDCMEAIIDYRGKTPTKTESGIPLITAKIIKNGAIQPITEFISPDDYDSWMRRGIPKAGDIVLTTEAPLGEVAQLDERKIALAQRVITLRGKEGLLDNTFLKYLLISNYVQHQLDGRGTGTTVKGIKQSELREVILRFPSLTVQKAIAHILGTLDDKIELNRRMNETLESMARALFKSWFVDFDPVIDNALAAGNPIPEPLHARAETRRALSNQTPSLSAHIKRLLPDDFRFNEEMGWIPEGWESIPVSKAITVNPRVSLKKGEVAKYVDMKALPTSGFAIDEVIEKAFSGGAKFLNSDVLMARITPCLENGKAGVVDYLGEDEAGFGSTEFNVLRPKGEIGTPFIAALVRDENFRSHCIANMVGSSGRQRVQNSCFDSYLLSLPSDAELLTTYDETCSAFFSRITTLKLESNALTRLRDTLLPKLLSGELRIPDAEQLVADSL